MFAQLPSIYEDSSLLAQHPMFACGNVRTFIFGQRNGPYVRQNARRTQFKFYSAASATASFPDASVEPRHSEDALPQSWAATELDDAAIERELRGFRASRNVSAHKSRTQPQSVQKIRSRVLRRKRAHARINKTTAEASDFVLPGKRLSREDQERLCAILREWARFQKFGIEEQSGQNLVEAPAISKTELQRLHKEGPIAAQALLASVDTLLKKFAWRCSFKGADTEDVLLEAQRLWLEAAVRCDWSRSSLNTFGMMCLRQQLPRTIGEQQSLIQKPWQASVLSFLIKQKESELDEQLNRHATVSEIAAELNVSRVRVKNLMTSIRSEVSLDSPAANLSNHDNETTVGEIIPSTEARSGRDTVFDGAVQLELKHNMQQLLQTHVQDDMNRSIMALRYGFEDGHSYSLEAIGQKFGLSREAIRKRIASVLLRMQADPQLRRELLPYMRDGALP